jgi:hypothetical protein
MQKLRGVRIRLLDLLLSSSNAFAAFGNSQTAAKPSTAQALPGDQEIHNA